MQLSQVHRDGVGPGEAERRSLDKCDWLRAVSMLCLFDKSALLDWAFRYADGDSSGSVELYEFQASDASLPYHCHVAATSL